MGPFYKKGIPGSFDGLKWLFFSDNVIIYIRSLRAVTCNLLPVLLNVSYLFAASNSTSDTIRTQSSQSFPTWHLYAF